MTPLWVRGPGNAVGVFSQQLRGQQYPHACTCCYFSSLAKLAQLAQRALILQ